jgi:hypothetical protein
MKLDGLPHHPYKATGESCTNWNEIRNAIRRAAEIKFQM